MISDHAMQTIEKGQKGGQKTRCSHGECNIWILKSINYLKWKREVVHNWRKYFTALWRKMRRKEERVALPMETRPQPDNHLIGIDSTIHTYARLIRGNQCWVAAETTSCDRHKERRRSWGRDSEDVLAEIGLLLLLSAVLNCVFRLEMRKCVFLNVWNCLCCDLWHAQAQTAGLSQDQFVSQRDANVPKTSHILHMQ